jgi:hypothetical protein
MKQFREFKSQQQVVNEIGPVGATIATAMGVVGGAMLLYKQLKKFKGYRESQKEKKQNEKTGLVVDLKVFNPETGETENRKKVVRGKDARVDNDGASKLEKQMQKDQDVKNAAAEVEFIDKGGPERIKQQQKDQETKPEPEQEPETSPEDKEKELRKKGDAGEIDNDNDANAYYKLVGKAPTGWETKKSKTGKSFTLVQKESKVLKFGEFIKEDVMKDMRKISKSKKDMEIKLDDGTEIPIDPMTAEIFVKYIEGLKSSEQKKVINQIQRTERGFMKVLGKAHGE